MRAFVILGLTSLSFFLIHSFVQAQSSMHPFPRLGAEMGKASIRQKGEEIKAKREGRVFRESLLVETSPGSLVRIDLSPTESLVVGPDSRLLLPGIDWETGRVEEMELLSGRVFLDLQEPRILRSALFRESVGRGRYEFMMNPAKPEFEALVFDGELSFRGLETEQKSKLTSGESQVFHGEIDEAQIQYDTLLEGRRVARGQLAPKTRLPTPELVRRANAYLIPEKKKVKKTRVEEISSGQGLGQKTGKNLCMKPAGQFNQCVYTCVNNPLKAKTCLAGQLNGKKSVQCVRQRCLANGQWGDDFTYAENEGPCEAKARVRSCDY